MTEPDEQLPDPAAPAAVTAFRDRIQEMRKVPIDLIDDFEAGNPVNRTPLDIEILDASLRANGYAMPIMLRAKADGRFETIDGHGRVSRIKVLWPAVSELNAIILDVATVAEGRKLLLGLRHNAEWSLPELDLWMGEALKDGDLTVDEAMTLSGLTAADLESLSDAGREFLDQLPDPPPTSPETGPDDAGVGEARQLSSAERAARIFVFSKERIAEACFQHYRSTGFPYPDPSPAECMLAVNRLASMSMEQLIRTHEGGPVADKFQRHRYEAIADGMISPMASFRDEKKLHYVIDMIVDSTGTLGDGTLRSMLGMVQGAQSCSNFRPGFAAYLYRRFCEPGGIVLDASHGYGGRLVGAIASTVVSRYIGIDPNTPSIEGSRKLLALLGRSDFASLIVEPCEDVDPGPWLGQCSFAFTSPPYWNKERYSDAMTQSGNRYPEVDEWREHFLVPMMKLQHDSLKPGAHAAVNIADVLDEGIRHPLAEWTVLAAKRVGFEHVGTLEFPVCGSRNFGPASKTAKDDAMEPVLLFRKDPSAKPSEPVEPKPKRPAAASSKKKVKA